MKKTILFILSFTFAFGITLYIKKEQSHNMVVVKTQWKTFVKTNGNVLNSHQTTHEEMTAAKIPQPKVEATDNKSAGRAIASVNPFKGFLVRNNRILMGEGGQKFDDENTELKMINTVSADWKESLGNGLMRFQPEDTKLMVKEEVSVIKVFGDKGRYLEQVTITYLKKFGNRSSFRALVDSETGAIVETWDRTVDEKLKKPRGGLFLPPVNESGIVTR